MNGSGRWVRLALVLGSVVLGVSGLSGVAQAQVGVYISGPSVYPDNLPPDPIPEYRPQAPGWGYVWVNGYWDWTGYDWVWNNGYWAPPRPGFSYIGPRFIWENGQPIYYRGYWQSPNGYREYGYGGRGFSPAWQARPQYEPRRWRAEPGHSEAWRRAPGAPPGGWREAPRFQHREMEHREMERREGAEHREAEHREDHREMEHREDHREMEHREERHEEHHDQGHEHGPGGPFRGPETRPAGGGMPGGGPPHAGGPPPGRPAPAGHAAPPPGERKRK
jgi:hypothetical protein